MGDHRADHEQNPADGGHRHHDRCDVEHGGQDETDRSQELEDPEGLDEADAGVSGPFPAVVLGQLLLGYERLGDAAGPGRLGQQSGGNPQAWRFSV